MKSIAYHWIGSIIILSFGIFWIIFSAPDPETVTGGLIPAPRQGFLSPDFTLQTLDGNTIQLSDLNDQVVLINFWATWCPPCRAEMPAMQRVYADYHHLGFEILAVNATNQDSLSAVANFIADYQLTFPILLDYDGEISKNYQVFSLPTSFFIDKNGVIQEMIIGGPMAEALLRIRIEQLIEGQS
ncbi:MAG: TlpA family protein disulfide reductase [Anaerolineales bacterium]|nr:TlpA family protein disulfide reductase [Anaerolineales bacterium]